MSKRPKYQSNFSGKHFVAKSANATFWQPTKTMRAAGFKPVPLGPDGPGAWDRAMEWEARWQAVRKGEAPAPAIIMEQDLSAEKADDLTVYPRGSIGEAFQKFRRSDEWKLKRKKRPHEDYWRAWKWIKPVFGDCNPKTVTFEDLSALRSEAVNKISEGEGHRLIKIWRVLWRIMAALQYCDAAADPSKAITNSAPDSRTAQWGEGEAVRLVKRAWRMKYYGLAAFLACLWSAQQQPGDIAQMQGGDLYIDNANRVFFSNRRRKTDKAFIALLSPRAWAVLRAYLDKMNIKLLENAPIFRGLTGLPYKTDLYLLQQNFRVIRTAEFGPGETRMMMDFRRSGTVEAFAGDAQPEHVSHAMANTIDRSNELFQTYNPVNVINVEKVQKAQVLGRQRMRGGGNGEQKLLKVGTMRSEKLERVQEAEG